MLDTDADTAARTALVLSGGGARGAYQAGALLGLLEIGCLAPERSNIGLLVGSSAGAINAGLLAATADRCAAGVERLVSVWRGLSADHVFRTDVVSLGSIGLRWVRDLTFGGMVGHVTGKALLDTAPLRQLIGREFQGGRIAENVADGTLRGVAIAATDLYSGSGVLFLEGAPDLKLWTRTHWSIERAVLGVDHFMASSAIPVFFPSVELGSRHFADGCIRNIAPLAPAIQLGADRIVAIGVRGGSVPSVDDGQRRPPPTIAQIAGVLLDAVLLDAIDSDIEHSERVNSSIIRRGGEQAAPGDFREIEVLSIKPSESIGAIAGELADRIPAVVRYLLRGLGSDEATRNLASYLLFDTTFCDRLIELGRSDVHADRAKIERFFARPLRPRA
ncbi:MAG: patatin-like phospholipase family protein [Deltaproteobacteria bacterium]|nr:patatin-like phospholipase family protein [Deltaproteobacteria bacterium]